MIETINNFETIKNLEIRKRCLISPKSQNTKHLLFTKSTGEAAFISVDIVESFDSLILYELYVPVKYREKGIGRDVLKELSNLALKIGYSKITVYPKPIDNNYSEQNLVKWYEKSGFKKKENKTGEYEYIIDPRQFVEVDRK